MVRSDTRAVSGARLGDAFFQPVAFFFLRLGMPLPDAKNASRRSPGRRPAVSRARTHGVAHSDARVTMRPPARRARWAGARTRAIVSSALLLVLPARALAKDRTLCFRLPSPSSLTAAPRDPDADPDPARVYLGMNAERCVPRAERDLRAAAVRARLPADDPALRCVDAHESFLCAADLAAPDDPFSCETLDGAEVYVRNETTEETCVWPVCEALCVQHPAPASSRAVHRRGAPRNANARTDVKNPPPSSARRHPSVCARCGRACAVSPPRRDTPGGRYCEALAAQRTTRPDANARYGNAWGCPGCDGGTSFQYLEAATTSLASRAQISAAAAALGSKPATVATAASAAASVATASSASVSLVANFLFVSARVALLNALFWAVVDRLYVVARPGEPLPGYVYAQGYVDGGGGFGDGKTPVVSPPPPPLVFNQGNEVPSPAVPAPPFPSPAGPAACGVGDIARSCVGECGMCIFAPDADTPNCCCDGECAEMGDCCGDFKTCCGGGSRLEPGVRVDARAGANRRVARRDDALFFPDETFGFERFETRPRRVASGAREVETVPIVVGGRGNARRGSQGSTMRG